MKSERIKVAIVSQSMNVGGGEMMAARLATYINKEKFNLKLFIISNRIENQIAELLDKSGIAFECLGLPTNFNFCSYRKFSKALKEFNPDVVHEHLDVCYSWVWCIIHNKALVATMHSDPFRRRSMRVAAVIKLKALQGNLRIIGCSKATMKLIKQCYKIKDEYMGYIYNPISVEDFVKSDRKDEYFKFVAIGRLADVKNYPLMLNAFKIVVSMHDNVHLSIAGIGPCAESLKDLVVRLGIQEQISFLGNVEDVPELLRKSDALLLSSYSEACPMVIIEAMAAGLPVIATNVGGVPELVTDNGIVVESDNIKAFSDAMIKMIEDKKLYKQMKEKSNEYVIQYDKSVISKKYEAEYCHLAEKG